MAAARRAASRVGRGWAISRPQAWFTEGTERKRQARSERVCVECRSALGSRRTPYCGRRCQWKFRGRYFWDAARTFVLYRDRYTCQVCRKKHRARDLEVDHVREIAAGGPTLEYANLQAICRPCHRLKTRTFLRARSARGAAPATDASGEGYWLEWFPT